MISSSSSLRMALPSTTASAILPTSSLMARMASSLDGPLIQADIVRGLDPDLRQRLARLELQSWYRAGDGTYEVLLRSPLTGRTEVSAISAVDG